MSRRSASPRGQRGLHEPAGSRAGAGEQSARERRTFATAGCRGTPDRVSPPQVQPLPPPLDHDRHVHLKGRSGQPLARRGIILLLAAFVVVALLNVFGQGTELTTAQGTAARLEVRIPHRARGGLFFQGRIDIFAATRIAKPTLVLGPGWTEQLQLNTIEPSPTDETSARDVLDVLGGSLDR